MGKGLEAGIYEDKETRDKKTRRQGEIRVHPRFQPLAEKKTLIGEG